MFKETVDLEKYLYHFTSHTTALEYVLPTQKIRFSPILRTNDPRESKKWTFSLSAPTDSPTNEEFFGLQEEFNRVFKENTKLLCLTRDTKPPQENFETIYAGRGFAHPRMWAQYAGNHTGVCLMFNKEKLNKAINNSLPSSLIKCGKVNYGTFSKRHIYAFNSINFDDVKRIGIEAAAHKHLEEYFDVLFLEKSYDWKDECEYRWILFSEEAEDYVLINYEDALEAIILGVDFPQVYEPIIEAYCRKFNVEASRMEWNNGNPIVLPVYNVTNKESFINEVF